MNETRDYFCPGHGIVTDPSTKYYNDMATLMFNSQETAIKQLFHQNGRVYATDVCLVSHVIMQVPSPCPPFGFSF